MPFTRTLMTSTALCLSLFATTASADLTAQDVWGDWRGYLEGMGYAVTGTEVASDGTLGVRDITVVANGGPETEAVTIQIGTLQFVENGDGSVDVVMPASMPMTLTMSGKNDNQPVTMDVLYTQGGQKMTARGDADALTYDYAADTFGLTLNTLTVGGEVMDQSTARFALNGTDLISKTEVSAGETRTYVQNMQLGSVTYNLFFKDPEGVEGMSINSTLNALEFTGTSSLPASGLPQTQDLGPLIAAGFAFDGTFNTNGTETEIEVTSEEGTTKVKSSSARSVLSVAMGQSGIRYGVNAEEVQIGGQLAGLPFPLFVEMAKSGFELNAPVMKTDTPQDFKIGFNMTDFTMSDIIWALFDPSGQLPRDPATVALDLSGKAKVLIDSFSSEVAQQMAASGSSPAEVHAVKINRLTVDAVGAKIEATGDIIFDNADKTTLPGIPKPVGDINIDLTGANALMDKLTAMGMLPAEQAMGARMMMGLFSVPGAAHDTLKSRIEFNEAGQILANGQRIK